MAASGTESHPGLAFHREILERLVYQALFVESLKVHRIQKLHKAAIKTADSRPAEFIFGGLSLLFLNFCEGLKYMNFWYIF